MKQLPVDVSSFKMMIENKYLYIDKTQYIYRLVTEGRLYFLSRPRRFGKSLLLSTLKELFLGNRELFKGLWIDTSDYQWQEHPVIHLDFSTLAKSNPEELKESLLWELKMIAQYYDVNVTLVPNLTSTLSHLIKELAKKNKVVILIDEYDKPILDTLVNVERATLIRDTLKTIYDVLKGVDEHIRAIFITGVTRFSRTSIFSGLNNLIDLTLSEKAAVLLGYTDEEMVTYFSEYIEVIAQKQQVTTQSIRDSLKLWYNGYRFSELPVKVYNPFSVLYYFYTHKLKNYWFASGTPSFLINLIKNQYYELEDMKAVEFKPEYVETFELNHIPLDTILFQAGYLTIAEYNHTNDKITLDYPNYEVKDSFVRYLVSILSYTTQKSLDTEVTSLIKTLDMHELEKFCSIVQTLFAHIPYSLHINQERYYHSLFQFLMTLISLEAHSEMLTNIGRIDIVIIMHNFIYIFELKYNKEPESALQQIIDKKYYERYAMLNKQVVLVGLSFIMRDNVFVVAHKSQDL